MSIYLSLGGLIGASLMAVIIFITRRFWDNSRVRKCKCQGCGQEVEVIVKGVGRCPNAKCANYYSWDGDVLWWNVGGTGIKFKGV